MLARPDVEGLAAHLRQVNGELAIVTTSAAGVDSVLFLTVELEPITSINVIRNPAKLTGVDLRPVP